MKFYLGTHKRHWLWSEHFFGVPLFVSRRRLADRPPKTYPKATTSWALDSGGFTELNMYGSWTLGTKLYVDEVRRYSDQLGPPDWCAPQDWMCEPVVTARTGLTVADHQRLTVDNFLELRSLAPDLRFVPVLQGFTLADYLRCIDLYTKSGIDLRSEPVVGLGTICRRQGTKEAVEIVNRLSSERISLHAFGAKVTGLRQYASSLHSSDSLAWSFSARKRPPLPGCKHRSCANCHKWALRWRERLLDDVSMCPPQQLTLF